MASLSNNPRFGRDESEATTRFRLALSRGADCALVHYLPDVRVPVLDA